MKIAIITTNFLPTIGGVEKYCHHLATELAKNHTVHILTSEDQNLPTTDYKLQAKYQTHFIKYKKFGKYKIPLAEDFTNTLKKIKPDIIHINGPLPYATISGLLAKKLKTPTIITYHGDVNPQNPFIKIGAWGDKQSYRFIFNHMIVTSDKYAQHVTHFFPEDKTSTVPLAIEDHFHKTTKPNSKKCRQDLKLDPQTKYILFVGRMDKHHYYKGLDTLIQTAKNFPLPTTDYKLPTNPHFLIIGDGADRPKYEKKAKDIPNITFLGEVDDKKLHKYYTAADLFVMPSNSSSEGFGIVLLEAAACGTPIITTHAVGSSEFITKHNMGLLITPDSPDELRNAIENLLQSDTLYNQFQQNGLSAVKELTWSNTAKQTEQIYQYLLTNQTK